jgi:hypothetical protein
MPSAAAQCKRHTAHTLTASIILLRFSLTLPACCRSGNGATFVSSSLGRGNNLSVTAGKASELATSVTMTFRNTGTLTWRVGRHALGTQCPQDNSVLTGSPRLALNHDVAPGEECAPLRGNGGDGTILLVITAFSAETKQLLVYAQVLFLRRAQGLVLQ